ncbi:hypothetical protein [Pseudomonas sp. CC120222-01a]|uniref:hypothetical protein n=1 Tax=Pseudomonas sp. CC120222-01a TaxID=1378075 RepID=UPI000D9ACA9A|nr:hypothetical protein [Pseudomonas sp. CC120222-01a]PVZ31252.1 hypothetical protein N430_05319 [Pseudomonas sp. CC120222-01a]
MANTQVFTLGLGVTVINPLGQAIDLLRRDVERLRRQADGTRLGRLIGEVIRLGLELGKVRQVERQLALDQEQQHEDQIARLGDETEAVERLRQHYLMLDRVIAGLARLRPLPGQITINVFQQWHAVVQGQVAPAASKLKVPAQVPRADAGGTSLTLGKGLAIAAGSLGALGLGTVYVRAYRKQPPEKQRAIRERGLTEWRENRAQTLAKVAKAVITGEDGEEMARGTGAALGDLGGRVLGALGAMLFRGKALGKVIGTGKSAAANKPRRTKKGQRKAHAKEQREAAKQQAAQEAEEKKQDEAAQKRWAEAGGLIGEAVGDRAGGGLFNLLTEDEDPTAHDSEASSVTEGQSEPQVAPFFSSNSAGKQLPSVGKFFKPVPVAAVLDTSLQLLDTYQSDSTPAEKLEGYGEAVGGLGGTLAGSSAGWLGGATAGAMIGSVVPGIGTVIGAAVGGALGSLGGGAFGGMAGEFAGGWLGKTVASVTGKDAPGGRPDSVNSPAQATRAQDSAGPAATSTQQLLAAVSPTINQQFTFTANMPVTFNNSLDDPTTLQQLETIARRMLEDLMRQARSVQMADQPQP